jgi:hypothetical protein
MLPVVVLGSSPDDDHHKLLAWIADAVENMRHRTFGCHNCRSIKLFLFPLRPQVSIYFAPVTTLIPRKILFLYALVGSAWFSYRAFQVLPAVSLLL